MKQTDLGSVLDGGTTRCSSFQRLLSAASLNRFSVRARRQGQIRGGSGETALEKVARPRGDIGGAGSADADSRRDVASTTGSIILSLSLVLIEVMAAFLAAFLRGADRNRREIAVMAVSLRARGRGKGGVLHAAAVQAGRGVGYHRGVALRRKRIHCRRVSTMLVSNMLFSQGPWTPWQMFAMGLVGLIAGGCSAGFLRGREGETMRVRRACHHRRLRRAYESLLGAHMGETAGHQSDTDIFRHRIPDGLRPRGGNGAVSVVRRESLCVRSSTGFAGTGTDCLNRKCRRDDQTIASRDFFFTFRLSRFQLSECLRLRSGYSSVGTGTCSSSQST